MALFFKIFFPAVVIALVVCFVMLVYSVQFKLKCMEQGGTPINGLCLKVDPSNVIKVVY